MRKRNFFAGLMLLLSSPILAQVTWTGAATGGDWQVGTNWSSGAMPMATDSVLLQSTGTDTLSLTNIPATVTITKLRINNAKVRLTGAVLAAAGTTTITISGAAGTDFIVSANSALVWSGGAVANAISINLATGATGDVAGFMQHTSAGVSHAHKFQAADSAAVNFRNGGTFVMGPGTSGNPFGAGVAPSGMKSMTFENGSTFIQNGGSNPFGAAAPSSVITLMPASNFRVNGTGTISAGGRTYGNLEFTNAGYIASSTATTLFTIAGNLTVNAGSPIFTASGTGGMEIKGNITVASGATLKFGTATACPVKLNGTTEQVITSNDRIIFDPAAPTTQLTLENPAGVRLEGGNLTITKALLVSGRIKLGNFDLRTITPGLGILGASTDRYVMTNGTGRLMMPVAAGSTAVFPVGLGATATDANQVRIVASAGDTLGVRVVASTDGFRSLNHAITRSWQISRTGSGAANLDEVKFGYNNNQVGSFTPAGSNFDLAALNGATWAALQTNLAPTATATTVNDKEVVTTAPITTLTTFALGTTGRVGAPNSIENTAAERGVRVFPSLATDVLTIENKNQGTFGYQITDIQGKIQLTGNMSNQTTVDISRLAKGVYLVRMNDATVRFVKQ